MRARNALGFSFSLHLLLAALLVVARASFPLALPNVPEVSWIEVAPKLGSDSINASPNQSPITKRTASPTKPATSQATRTLAPAQENAMPAAGEYSPEMLARRMSLEESYLASVRHTLERNKKYPPLAKRLGQTGNITLKFELNKNGDLVSSELTQLSPHPVLNEAAKELITIVRFPPIPQELERSSWQFTYLVKYSLE